MTNKEGWEDKMIMSEQRFRVLCRGEMGGIESAKFQEALDKDTVSDSLPVTFEVGFRETKTFHISREEAIMYAQLAKEEAAPETELLKYIKPTIVQWAIYNRRAMCERLRHAISKYNPEKETDVIIVWPHATPDVVPYELARKYVEKYGG